VPTYSCHPRDTHEASALHRSGNASVDVMSPKIADRLWHRHARISPCTLIREATLLLDAIPFLSMEFAFERKLEIPAAARNRFRGTTIRGYESRKTEVQKEVHNTVVDRRFLDSFFLLRYRRSDWFFSQSINLCDRDALV